MYKEEPVFDTDGYIPSFVGKTWGEMKQMEFNRTLTTEKLFKMQCLDKDLKILEESFEQCIKEQTFKSVSYDELIESWNQKPSDPLNFNDLCLDSNIIKSCLKNLPIDVRSFIFNPWYDAMCIPVSLADRTNLSALCVCVDILPVMPHVKILKWGPVNSYFSFDFSGWVSLQILKIDIPTFTETQIRLPPNLVSLHLKFGSTTFGPTSRSQKFSDIFGNDEYNINILKSLVYVELINVQWVKMPSLTKCEYVVLSHCSYLKNIEAPHCKSLTASYCKSFMGFGPLTLLDNKSLEHVDLSSLPEMHHLPSGALSGYRYIKIYNTKIYTFPNNFAPYAYVSIISRIQSFNPYIYISSKRVRETMAFYYDKEQAQAFNRIECPKQNETVEQMIDRLYSFNWPKFFTKIQRQYRFKKYMSNIHPILSMFVSPYICVYGLAKLLGASKSFGSRRMRRCGLLEAV